MTAPLISSDLGLGAINGHCVGIILKELVRRAMVAIKNQRLIFEAMAKDTPNRPNDLVTTADLEAQLKYVKSLLECFPGLGIIAEEHNLRQACTIPGQQVYAVVDPLDGTKAFARRQSAGVATQIAMIDFATGRVLAAYVGNINTGEVYGYRPNSANVHRLTELIYSEKLSDLDRTKPLAHQAAVLREHPNTYSWLVRRLITPSPVGIVKHILIDNGSMSVMAAKLWKGEVGLLISGAFDDTPWDCGPVFGINQALGFVAVTPDMEARAFKPFKTAVPAKVQTRTEELVWIHQSHLSELQDWASNQ